jgi:4-carboxymuconolactone decarboxylase
MRRLRPAILAVLAVTVLRSAAQQTQPSPPSGKEPIMSILHDVRSVAPALAVYTDQVLIGDLWKRTDLTPRDRSLVTVTALIAANQMVLLPVYLDRALDDGVKPSEVSEIITHLAFYTGWPNSFSASGVAKNVFARRGIGIEQLTGLGDLLTLDAESEKQRIASVEQALGSVAPAFRDYTNGVLFGDLWRRPGLSPRDRGLVTISALIVGNKTQQFVGHLNRALDNGLTKAEAGAVITHLAFYAGWPNAMSAASVAKQVFDKRS